MLSRKNRGPVATILIYALLLGAGLAFLAPFVWMVSTSLKPLNETMSLPPRWMPSVFQWRNYPDAIHAMGYFWRYVGNTLFVCVMTVIGTVASSSLAAYGFSRIDWKGRDKLFLVLLSTMMIPFPVIMVPIFGLFKELGWIGTFRPLWVPAFFAGAFNVFLLRQFFLSLPRDISDAARMDGCNEFQIFLRIILPLCKPALLVVALFQFMFSWNDFLAPLIFLTEQKDFTLALGLQSFQSQQGGTAWHQLMAASTLVVLPVLILFFFTQRAFMEGISSTGMKN
jgi:multiple sugar transport system permease protein